MTSALTSECEAMFALATHSGNLLLVKMPPPSSPGIYPVNYIENLVMPSRKMNALRVSFNNSSLFISFLPKS